MKIGILKPEEAAKKALAKVAAFKAAKVKGVLEGKANPAQGPAPIVEEKGAPQSKEELGRLLGKSALDGNWGEAERLLRAGADANTYAADGTPVLAHAARHAQNEVVKLLIAKGAYVDAPDNGGWTALMVAACMKHYETAKILVASGAAELDHKKPGGTTVMMVAAGVGAKNIVELLIDAGADVNAKNSDKDTALKLASRNGHEDIVKLLRQHGAKRWVLW